jgi:hypothetical protein
MAVLKEWECASHGPFEGSHPVCPELGCDSSSVKQVFLTPPNIGSQALKRFDRGIRRSAEMMGISNFRSARAGEQAYGGDAAKKAGMEMLWGDDVQRILGKSVGELSAAAQAPLTITKGNGERETLTRNNGMADAATELGITKRALPKAGEIISHKGDVTPAKLKQIAS